MLQVIWDTDTNFNLMLERMEAFNPNEFIVRKVVDDYDNDIALMLKLKGYNATVEVFPTGKVIITAPNEYIDIVKRRVAPLLVNEDGKLAKWWNERRNEKLMLPLKPILPIVREACSDPVVRSGLRKLANPERAKVVIDAIRSVIKEADPGPSAPFINHLIQLASDEAKAAYAAGDLERFYAIKSIIEALRPYRSLSRSDLPRWVMAFEYRIYGLEKLFPRIANFYRYGWSAPYLSDRYIKASSLLGRLYGGGGGVDSADPLPLGANGSTTQGSASDERFVWHF